MSRRFTAAVLALAWCALQTARAGSLASVSPSGATAGVAISIIGSGFDAAPAKDLVTFTPTSGTPATVAASSVGAPDASGLRRLTVTVPAGLPAGAAAIKVKNATTGEISQGKSLDVLQLSLPETKTAAPGATGVVVRIIGSPNTKFVAGAGTRVTIGTAGTGITVASTTVDSPTSLRATINVAANAAAGPRDVGVVTSTQTALVSGGFSIVVPAPNRAPTITSQPFTTATEAAPYAYTVTASDPDGDAVTFRLVTAPAGMTISSTGAIAWTPAATQTGPQNVVVEAADTRGGTDRQTFTIVVAAAVKLTGVTVMPEAVRFSTLVTSRPLTVTGARSDGTSIDLTHAAQTTYESGSPFVATVDGAGTVQSVANGSATITVHHLQFSDTVAVTVEAGVTLDSLELRPVSSTLRSAGAAVDLTLLGHFSNGDTRDLTTDPGTSFQSSDGGVATIAGARVTAVANGDATIVGRFEALSATALVRVAISSGTGFLRGEAFDDSRGLPLGGVTATLVADGGGAVSPPISVIADERGRFVLSGRAGEAVVRIARAGFTTVERTATIQSGAAATLLDARLTPVDGRANVIASAFGGQARDAAGRVTLIVPPGGLATDTDLRVTPIGAQGLRARLPAGWSPVAAAEISPGNGDDVAFAQPAALTLPNVAGIAANSDVVVAVHDAAQHAWIAAATARVSGDGRSIVVSIVRSGQVACLAADDPPFTPPPAQTGSAIAGITAVPLPAGVTATGEVLPRSAPPGDQARATGRVLLQHTATLPSGAVVQARVSETFDLLDQSQAAPSPFTEDIVLYSRGRPAGTGVLGASFPITPSRSYTIQELLRGVVVLDVAAATDEPAASIVGSAGGTVVNAAGDALDVPAAAVATDTVFGLRRVDAGQTSAPTSFDLLAALDLDLVGVTLAQPARLSIAAPAGLTVSDQIVVALAFQDPVGTTRLRLVAVAAIEGGRLASRTSVGSLALPGAVAGGRYLFLRSQQALGFVGGQVVGPDGTTPRPQAPVTADTAPFADVSGADGRFAIAARAAVDSAIRATDLTAHDVATVTVHIAARDEVATARLVLTVVVPTVTATSPAANAANVPLDSPIAIDFSEAIDPASVGDSSVVLRAGASTVAGQRALSPDRRRLTFRPASPLLGKTSYTLTLTGIVGQTGRALAGFPPLSFTTLDPSKPAVATAGLITADLPDQDNSVLIGGGTGTSEANGAVTATNLRTQETMTVLALADGSFRLRIAALVGDELSLTLRDSAGRDTTIAITQFESADGVAGIGERGGTVHGADGRTGRILPRALAHAGTFRLDVASGTTVPPTLPAGFTYADLFTLSISGAQFNRLTSLNLSESQNRFAPAASTTAAFEASGELTVPGDFLASASLRFSATAVDASGVSRAASASTVVVAGGPDSSTAENGQAADFPTVFVTAPRQALQNQIVRVEAVAPTARIDFERPAPAGSDTAAALLLVRHQVVNGEPTLVIADTLARIDRDGSPLLQTNGRALPGLSVAGDYGVVASSEPLAFVTGRVPAGNVLVTADGLPFVAIVDAPNGSFTLPVRAGQPFTVRYFDAASHTALGSSGGQAPAAGAPGALDLGQPLAPTATQLAVVVEPDANAVVDIGTPIVFHFSTAIDARTLTDGLVVTDDVGARVFGTIALATDGRTATFKPSRRWRYGRTYRWGLSASVVAVSGARFRQAVGDSFTTFAPRVVNTLPSDRALVDVAVDGSTLVGATDAGLIVVDHSSPQAPEMRAQLPIAGGARGVAMLPAHSLTDRTGRTLTGSFALVADAGGATAGRLDVVDVSALAAPAVVGFTQLTAAANGSPNAVVTTTDGRAIVAVKDFGIESVRIADSLPADPANPGRAITARYPASGVENLTQTAVVGNRVVAIGENGLSVFDGSTLVRRGRVSTTGVPQSVAALAHFSLDVDGDGSIAAATEIFDLAAVANGADGTLQLYRVPATGDPSLLSVVHFTGETRSVSVDAAERLAYVGLGSRGIAIVDLDGPASIQPVDIDHDGVDDRILGIVDTPGDAGRIALALGRGLAFVADGAAGVTCVRVLPPRTKFLTFLRDPVANYTGDEESILTSRRAFTTDDRIAVSIEATVPPQETAVLVLDEQASGARALSFADGSAVATIQSGLNSFAIRVARDAAPATATLTARTQGGATLATLPFELASPDPGGALRSLFIAPSTLVLPTNVDSSQLGVGGRFADGRFFNLTRSTSGSTYAISDSQVATVDGEGLVAAIAGGRAQVDVRNGTLGASATVQVQRPATLVALEARTPRLTLIRRNVPVPLDVIGRFSDGSTQPASAIGGTQFVSSAPAIVGVTPDGTATAISTGLVTITASNGTVQTQIDVDAQPGVDAALTSIVLEPISTPVTADDGAVDLHASIQGSGTLAGLTVVFTTQGATTGTIDGLTTFAGDVDARLTGLTVAGAVSVRASIVDPATGATLSDTKTFTVAAGTGDNEPNNTDAGASPLAAGVASTGSLNGTSDPRDVYRLQTSADGTITISLDVSAGAPADLVLVVRDANGVEIARITPTKASNRFEANVPAGAAFVSVETTAGPASYSLSFGYKQAPLRITSVNPLAGGPGTLVTIVGSGFTTAPDETRVTFGRVIGKLVSVTPGAIQVQVPSRGVDGPLGIVSGKQAITGPVFTTGTAVAAAGFVQPEDPAMLRLDPVTDQIVDITRLVMRADPLATRSAIDALAAGVGGIVVGDLPLVNSYVLSFPENRTFAGLEDLRRQLTASPLVTGFVQLGESTVSMHRIDTRENGGLWPGLQVRRGSAFEHVLLYDAIDAIRRTPPFRDAHKLRPVRVAVIDSGFAPFSMRDFTPAGGTPIVTALKPQPAVPPALPSFLPVDPARLSDIGDHGTPVTGVIAALNDGNEFSGTLGALVGAGEPPPFSALVYYCGSGPKTISPSCGIAALHDLARRIQADPIPTIVNMSWGTPYGVRNRAFNSTATLWRDMFAAFSSAALFVVAPGNDGIFADTDLPGAIAGTVPNGLNVGASDLGDLRADFGPPERRLKRGEVPCATPRTDGSDCGDTIELVAPGSAVFSVSKRAPGFLPLELSFGTSLAAPIVSGVAAMLQTIRDPQSTADPASIPGIASEEIKTDLIFSSDDITRHWRPIRPGNLMGRLNALGAVRRRLPPSTSQKVIISDSTQNTFHQGHLIGIEMDPINGQRVSRPTDTLIPLSVANPVTPFNTPADSAIAASTGLIYVVARGFEGVGDGILVVNTHTQLGEKFIAFSGDDFDPSATSHPTPVVLDHFRGGLALSQDERLLYVAVGGRFFIVNTVSQKIARDWDDLPDPYRPWYSPLRPFDTLDFRLTRVKDAIGSAEMRNLAVSADGRTLYVVGSSGTGTGVQPGFILPIDIDLYTDGDATLGLQPSLATYLTVGSPETVVDEFGRMNGDEPAEAAVNPAGGQVYVTHSGYDHITGIVPGSGSDAIYGAFVDPLLIGRGAAGAAGALDFVEKMASQGFTLLDAPGLIGAFDAAGIGAIGAQAAMFPSEVVFPWQPANNTGSEGDPNSGVIVNQLNFPQIFAKRPNGITMRPDGRRALISYIQTGNFGVLDTDTQAAFPDAPPPQPGVFTGLAAVTESVALDKYLTPSRGAFTSDIATVDGGQPVHDVPVPSRDEALLFLGPVRYAQNGRFAVGVHAGARPPQHINAQLPDFTNDSKRKKLTAVGFTIAPGATSGTDPFGVQVTSNGTYRVDRGGGAVTIIDDAAISHDLNANARQTLIGRPYFATRPVCDQATPVLQGLGCTTSPFEQLLTFTAPDSTVLQFNAPRSVAIEPFASIESPRSGDIVIQSTPIVIRWRDARASEAAITVKDLSTGVAPSLAPAIGQELRINLSESQTAKLTFEDVLLGVLGQANATLPPNRLYRIEVSITSDEGFISSTFVDVRF